jgi:hypothetical protein
MLNEIFIIFFLWERLLAAIQVIYSAVRPSFPLARPVKALGEAALFFKSPGQGGDLAHPDQDQGGVG